MQLIKLFLPKQWSRRWHCQRLYTCCRFNLHYSEDTGAFIVASLFHSTKTTEATW